MIWKVETMAVKKKKKKRENRLAKVWKAQEFMQLDKMVPRQKGERGKEGGQTD